jgi:hypothetical protein
MHRRPKVNTECHDKRATNKVQHGVIVEDLASGSTADADNVTLSEPKAEIASLGFSNSSFPE